MRAVLTYHSIDESGSPISVSPAVFAEQMRWLSGSGPRVVPLAGLSGVPVDEEAVALTFDDAFRNFAERALPILVDHGLPATLFVVSGHVGRDNRWGGRGQAGIPDLPLMDWDALGRAAEAGIDLGGHTRTHPRLDRVPSARRVDEIEGCAHDLEERLGLRPRSFAYPYGAVDAEAERIAARGYDRAVTTELRALAPADPPHRMPRLDMYYWRQPGSLERWGPGFRLRLAVRRALRAARSALGPDG